jgi:deoxyribonuclease-4
MGKVNVFGSVEEIRNLVSDTKCSFCIDFAHILARDKDYRFEEVLNLFKDFKEIHIHFSGIVYGEKGEKHHKVTPESEMKKLVEALNKFAKGKDIVIANESPEPIKDSVMGLKILKRIEKS